MSKPTEEQVKLIKEQIANDDTEGIHIEYDIAIKGRLRELDPEFVEEMDKLTKGVTFWYA